MAMMIFQYLILVLILVFISFGQAAFAVKRYDDAQLLELINIDNSTLLDILTDQYGGSIWNEKPPHNLDISFEKENVSAAKDLLIQNGIDFNVLIPNLQDLIDSSAANTTERAATFMNWKTYHRFATISQFLYNMQGKYPNIAKVFQIGTTIHNRQLNVIRITSNINNEAIWIDGGIHAREWISPASVSYIIYYLLENWAKLPAKLKNKTWYILPVMNPDGYEYSFTNDRLWRKNRKQFAGSSCVGVDLNRNFNVAWNAKSQTSDKCAETFKGLAPFSERETTAVKNFLTSRRTKLKAVMTYHSYGQYILWPWGYTTAGQAPNAFAMETTARTAAARIKSLTGTSYRPSRGIYIMGQVAGTTRDWSKKVLGIPYTYTVELRDTGTYAFLLPAAQIFPTAREALEVAKTVALAI